MQLNRLGHEVHALVELEGAECIAGEQPLQPSSIVGEYRFTEGQQPVEEMARILGGVAQVPHAEVIQSVRVGEVRPHHRLDQPGACGFQDRYPGLICHHPSSSASVARHALGFDSRASPEPEHPHCTHAVAQKATPASV